MQLRIIVYSVNSWSYDLHTTFVKKNCVRFESSLRDSAVSSFFHKLINRFVIREKNQAVHEFPVAIDQLYQYV